jgi:hypothetical protein
MEIHARFDSERAGNFRNARVSGFYVRANFSTRALWEITCVRGGQRARPGRKRARDFSHTRVGGKNVRVKFHTRAFAPGTCAEKSLRARRGREHARFPADARVAFPNAGGMVFYAGVFSRHARVFGVKAHAVFG